MEHLMYSQKEKYSAHGLRLRQSPFDAPAWGTTYPFVESDSASPWGKTTPRKEEIVPPSRPLSHLNPYSERRNMPQCQPAPIPRARVYLQDPQINYLPPVTGARQYTRGVDKRYPGSLAHTGGKIPDRYPGEYQEQASASVQMAFDDSVAAYPDRPLNVQVNRSAYHRPSSLF